MSFKECKCPNCSMTTIVDDSRLNCYCIYCAYSIPVSSVSKTNADIGVATSSPTTKTDIDLVKVSIGVPSIGYECVVYIDDKEVLRSIGGTETIQVKPGKHNVKVKCSVFSGSAEGVLKEGSRIIASTGFMGLKVSIS